MKRYIEIEKLVYQEIEKTVLEIRKEMVIAISLG